jgi:OmpA-OmpF porin, OOP family
MALRILAAVALATIPVVATGEDYVGLLKPSKAGLSAPPGFFALSSEPVSPFATARPSDNGIRLKVGYRYSRYLSVEGEFVDFGRTPQEIFATQGNLASAFRASGFGVDTVATVPLWRSFSFYGRLGATRGETRNAFSAYSTSILGDHATRGARLRYGLGMRYDFTKAFGIRAELERYSPLGSTLASDAEADLFTVGVMWRF